MPAKPLVCHVIFFKKKSCIFAFPSNNGIYYTKFNISQLIDF